MSDSPRHPESVSHSTGSDIYNKNFVISRANTAKSKQWNRQELNYEQFCDAFSNHREDKRKDGPAFVPGEIMGGERKAMAVSTIYAAVFDIDAMQTYDEVRDIINKHQLEAIMFTTYSHMKTTSHIKTDNFVRWAQKANVEPESGKQLHTQANVDRYVDEELGEKGRAKLGGKFTVRERLDHTSEGMMIAVDHAPIQKFRVVLPFDQPFIFSSHGYTSAEQVQNWKRWYFGIGRHLGFKFDESCADPPRLYYFPSHPPGDENFRLDHLLSDPENPDAIKRKMLDFYKIQQVEVGPEGRTRTATTNLRSEHSEGNAGDDEIRQWLKHHRGTHMLATALANNKRVALIERERGGYTLNCPHGAQHGDGNEGGAFVVDPIDDVPFVFSCSHNGCKHKTTTDKVDVAVFLTKMLELGWITRADLENRELGGGPLPQSRETVAGLHDRIKLLTLLGAEIVPDPSDPSRKLRVRDAQIIGQAPVVEYENGESVADVAAYVEALTAGMDIRPEHLISDDEVKDMCDPTRLGSLEWVKANTTPHQLSTPNLPLIEAVIPFGGGEDDAKLSGQKLRVTLAYNARFKLVAKSGQMVVLSGDESFRVKDFGIYVENEQDDYDYADTKPKRMTRASVWIAHPARATFDGLDNAPMGCDNHGRVKDMSRKVNLWVEPVIKPKPGNCDLFHQHLLEILCSGNREHYDYVLNWLAHMFQKPYEKPGVAIVTWGAKRTGKGTIADMVRALLGSAMARLITQKEHVVGRFAGSARPLMFMQVEEAVFSRDPTQENPLKSKIADEEENVELKFQTPVGIPSFTRYWFNSNSDQPVPITADEERYFVLHVSSARKGDHDYFAKLRQQMYHEGGLEGLMYELLARDIRAFNVRKFPVTVAQREMTERALKGPEAKLLEVLKDGRLYKRMGAAEIDIVLHPDVVTFANKEDVATALEDAFKRHGSREALKGDITRTLTAWGVIVGERKADKRHKHPAYKFAPLIDARQAFLKAFPTLPDDVFDQEGGGDGLDELLAVCQDRLSRALYDDPHTQMEVGRLMNAIRQKVGGGSEALVEGFVVRSLRERSERLEGVNGRDLRMDGRAWGMLEVCH